MARFYFDGVLEPGARIELGAQIARHVRVLRLRPGEQIVLFDGRGGEVPARLERQDRGGVLVELGERRMLERESPLRVTLVQGVSTAERMDLTIQKSVELGVSAIQPVLAGKSVVRFDAGRAAAKLAHWRRVAIAACEQCGRNRVPGIEAPRTVAEYCRAPQPGVLRILLSPLGGKSLKELLAARPSAMLLAAGPEGGFDAGEEALFAGAGFVAVRLGPRILRTETAAPAALAAINALAGDF